MADISYTPAFHHTPWVDRVDRVEAAGPNGFNLRFTGIEDDLQGLSSVVGQIATAIDDVGGPPPPPQGDQRLTFTPLLNGFWTYDLTGQPSVTMTTFTSPSGVMNLALPDGARMTKLTMRGEFGGTIDAGIDFSVHTILSRVPLAVTIPPVARDDLANAGFSGKQRSGVFEFAADVLPSLAQVDQGTFRYFLTASATSATTNPFTINLRAVELVYTFAG
jgi:hypothetical protein